MARKLIGMVVSVQNTSSVVKVTHHKTHPLYKKRYMSSKRYGVHDAAQQAKVGDLVEIVETRPVSRRKRFSLGRILEHSPETSEGK